MTATHWILIFILPILLSSVTAYTGAMFLKPVFAARAEIMLHMGGSSESANRYLGTQSAIVRSYAVLNSISQKFPQSVETLRKNLKVDFPLDGSIMTIQYSDAVGIVALNILQAIIENYKKTLEPIESRENTGHEVISGPYLLEDPVRPRPFQAAALGAVVGLAITFGAALLIQRLRGAW